MDAGEQWARTPATPPDGPRMRAEVLARTGGSRVGRQLEAAGLEGDMDGCVRAYLDLLLGKDSESARTPAGGQDGGGPG